MRSFLAFIVYSLDGLTAAIITVLVSGLFAGAFLILQGKVLAGTLAHWRRFLLLGLFCSLIPFLSLIVLSTPYIPAWLTSVLGNGADLITALASKLHSEWLMLLLPGLSSLFLWPLVYLVFYVEAPKINRRSKLFTCLSLGTVGLVTAGIAFWGIFFSLLQFGESYDDAEIYFHEFNAHLKDLCWRTDMRECPKNETELKAFNPQNYDSLKQIAAVTYSYNSTRHTYEFRVKVTGKSYTLVGNPTSSEGFTLEQ